VHDIPPDILLGLRDNPSKIQKSRYRVGAGRKPQAISRLDENTDSPTSGGRSSPRVLQSPIPGGRRARGVFKADDCPDADTVRTKAGSEPRTDGRCFSSPGGTAAGRAHTRDGSPPGGSFCSATDRNGEARRLDGNRRGSTRSPSRSAVRRTQGKGTNPRHRPPHTTTGRNRCVYSSPFAPGHIRISSIPKRDFIFRTILSSRPGRCDQG